MYSVLINLSLILIKAKFERRFNLNDIKFEVENENTVGNIYIDIGSE